MLKVESELLIKDPRGALQNRMVNGCAINIEMLGRSFVTVLILKLAATARYNSSNLITPVDAQICSCTEHSSQQQQKRFHKFTTNVHWACLGYRVKCAAVDCKRAKPFWFVEI